MEIVAMLYNRDLNCKIVRFTILAMPNILNRKRNRNSTKSPTELVELGEIDGIVRV